MFLRFLRQLSSPQPSPMAIVTTTTTKDDAPPHASPPPQAASQQPPPPPPSKNALEPTIADKVAAVRARVDRVPPALVKDLAMQLSETAVDEIDPSDLNTPDDWVPRHKDLIRLTGRHPFNCEPPLELLMSEGWITPPSIHYVRNHGAVPRIEEDKHSLTVSGLVNNPRTFTMKELKQMPATTFPVTLVCAGNRRNEQNRIKKTIGFSWGAAGVSNALWTGVLLVDLIRACGGVSDEAEARFVTFEGVEDLPHGKYGTSVAAETALDERNDILIAYEMNGEPLTPDHGFPVRVIIPGFIGGRMVKWLGNISVAPGETTSYYHYHDNRVLPSPADSSEAANRDGWWYRTEFIINELNINSAITTPNHDARLTFLPRSPTAGIPPTREPYTLQGYAYSGGGRKITRVEVSFDSGKTWRFATVHPYPDSKGHVRHRSRYWCWFFWSYVVEDFEEVLRECCGVGEGADGVGEICVRAWDASTNTQPSRPTWNLMGMLNNPWFRVRVHLHTEPDGTTTVRFEHPTLAANTTAGWMKASDPSAWEISRGTAATLPSPPPSEGSASPVAAPAAEEQAPVRWIAMEEVKMHESETDCWIVVGGKVYDVTGFLDDHPGGAQSILLATGQDATDEFESIHSQKAHEMLAAYYIGHLSADSKPHEPTPVPAQPNEQDKNLLSPKDFRPWLLTERRELSPDTLLLRFAFPPTAPADATTGILPGQHILLRGLDPDSHRAVIRAYTPVSLDTWVPSERSLDLVVKIYRTTPERPGGKMSAVLDALRPARDTVDMKGPLGEIIYLGEGKFSIARGAVDAAGLLGGEVAGRSLPSRITLRATRVSFVAGGSGITPCYQVMRAIACEHDRGVPTAPRMWLLYANRRAADILLKRELDAMQKRLASAVSVRFTLSGIAPARWEGMTGRVDETMLRHYLARAPVGVMREEEGVWDVESLVFLCGPEGMVEAGVGYLERIGFKKGCSMFVF
ncbi:hypothetical protein HDU96_010807 [Phlyctochytrium bullatum]|nr:hypothetical protein HDU96_010807 [Phlyctochytrium bullatum]